MLYCEYDTRAQSVCSFYCHYYSTIVSVGACIGGVNGPQMRARATTLAVADRAKGGVSDPA